MRLIDSLIQLYIFAVIVRVILSWVSVNPDNQFAQFLIKITEPVLVKIRQVVPPLGGIDLSPMILIFGLYILRILLLY